MTTLFNYIYNFMNTGWFDLVWITLVLTETYVLVKLYNMTLKEKEERLVKKIEDYFTK